MLWRSTVTRRQPRTADLIAAEGLSGDAAACDATDGTAVADLVDDVIGAHGRIDI